jgi:signal transduction histidine kinase
MSTNLLDLSRIDSGIFPLDMRWGDLRDPVRSVVEAHAEVAELRGVALVSEVPTNPVMLRFDRERLNQLLTNLVGNALKFTPRGGEIVVALAEAPENAVVEVRDSGPGIPETELPHVFDRFFRGTNVGEARASGSGLGLAIVRSIVEMHGGSIRVASSVGRGSTFTVELPKKDGEGS